MALARITEAVDEDGKKLARLRRNNGCFLLQLQSLEKVAEGRETGRDEDGRGGGADGDVNAVEDGGLARLRHAVVLDGRLEIGEQLQARVDGRRRLL